MSDFRLHAQLSESLRRLKAGESISDLNHEATMRSKLPAIPSPFGDLDPDAVKRAKDIPGLKNTNGSLREPPPFDYATLDTPAVLRRAEPDKAQLDADALLVCDALMVREGEVIDLEVSTERARQVIGILAMSGRLAP